jgi:hypothetical protein
VPPALADAVARALHRDPERRYADAAEMETALRDGLRGRAPAETDATWAVGDETAATQMLSGTSATSAMPRTSSQTAPRRQLEPLADQAPPRRAAAARRPSAPPPRERSGGGGMRLFVALVVVLALAAAGFAGYQALSGSDTKSVQLREDVGGKAQQAIDELRGLIEDNTQ